MTERGKEALVVLLLGATALYAAASLQRAPRLGPSLPVAACELPVEEEGAGVRCLDAAEGQRLSVRPGDRVARDGTRGRMAPARLRLFSAAVDLNAATVAELASLPGIGPTMAARIAAARPFLSVAAVADVPGIGRHRFQSIAPRLFLEPR